MESDCVILTKAGKEVAVATTKAYSAQLTVIYTLIIYLSVLSGEMNKKTAGSLIDELKEIPEKVKLILNSNYNYKEIANKILKSEYICFIGRKYGYCTATEASLKLKEISYIPCEAYAAGELKHGTISLIDNKSLIIALNCSKEMKTKLESNIEEASARGAEILSISTNQIKNNINIPETIDFFYPLLEIIPLQLIAYYTALEKNCEIDKPRNLAKSVTVE